MTGEQPLLTIVIPVRNRAKYLPSVLRTVLEQSFRDVEVLVVDNASSDGTDRLVAQIADERVRYFPSNSVLGMSENWERGLEFARGEYVFYLGGDDGLMPESLSEVAFLVERFSPPALSWQKPDYTWPDADPPSSLQVMLPGPLRWLDAKMILRLLCAGRTNYGLLPNIYSSFVRRTSIERIRAEKGRFFGSVTPDVYSAISLVSEFQDFLFSPYPFSISGASGASNGMANARVGGLENFFAEAGLPMHPDMPVIAGSISSAVLEALLTANDAIFGGRLHINRKRYIKLIVRELKERHPEIRNLGLLAIKDLNLTPGERRYFVSAAGTASESSEGALDAGEQQAYQYEARNNVVRVDDCEALGVRDIYDAAALVRRLVGPFKPPTEVARLSWRGLGVETAQRGVTRLVRGTGASQRGPVSVLDL
jgi:glycosyltransferase involved in cell wall biosynthesis